MSANGAFYNVRNLAAVPLRDFKRWSLNHYPAHVLGTRIPHQNTAIITQFSFHLPDNPHNLRQGGNL
jgi:hypothetical protein